MAAVAEIMERTADSDLASPTATPTVSTPNLGINVGQ